MRWRPYAIMALIGLSTLPALAREPSAALLKRLPALGGGVVAGVEPGEVLRLADGRQIKLAGIALPLPPLGHAPDAPWPPGEAAHAAALDLLLGRGVTLFGAADAIDRYGRLVVQVRRDDGAWIEGALVIRGMARVEIDPDAAELTRRLLALEARARRRNLGLWANPAYAVRAINGLARDSGSYQIVEGTILSVAQRSGAVWLEFTGDGQGFAARIARPAHSFFTQAGLDPASLIGQPIRLRGWILYLGRPVLELTHPAAIEAQTQPRRHH